MKFAYMIATKEIQGSRITAIKGEYNYLFQLLKDNGYSGVELMVKDPFAVNFEEIKRASEKHALAVPVMCTGEIYGEDGLSFGDCNRQSRKEALRRTKELMKRAGDFNAHVNVGRLRGRYEEGVPKEDTLKLIKEGLLEAACSCKEVNLLIEPINRNISNFILTTQEGLDFIKELNMPNIRLMLDYIHMVVEEEDIKESVESAQGYFDHVHVCDSDRKPPGLGEYDFADFLKCLKSINYKGYVSVEAFPTSDFQEDVRKSIQVLKNACDIKQADEPGGK